MFAKKPFLSTLALAAALVTMSLGTAYAHNHGNKATDAMSKVNAAKETVTKAASGNIVETAVAAGQFKTLASLLTQTGLVEALQGEGPFTVFAPTDEAFAKVPKEALAALAADPEQLKQVLLYHVVSGSVDAATVTTLDSAKTLAGPTVAIKVEDGKVKVNTATVTKADIKTSNGIIHVIDTVLLPPAAGEAKAAPAADTSTMTISEIAAGNKDFSTLVSLLSSAGLVEALNGDGPFTVFAPTDAAFKKVPAETLASLGANPEQLKAVLLYHVVPGKVTSDAITSEIKAKTLQGTEVTVKPWEGKVKVDGATVTAADIMAKNGVIHVIDTVIIPGAPKAAKAY